MAESAKSFAWWFSIGAMPFHAAEKHATEQRFTGQMWQLLADAPPTSISPPDCGAITEGMRRLRASNLATRKAS